MFGGGLQMDPSLRLYMAAWVSTLIVSALVAVRARSAIGLFHADYWAFLLKPWKVTMFAVGLLGIVAMAPMTGDPTWDYFDAAFMAILAFTTAPWAVGTLYRAFTQEPRRLSPVFVAVTVWVFSASWSYDGYLLLRDGIYPATWTWNLVVSSCLYFLAGLFWNLDWSESRGSHFSFQQVRWPVPSTVPFRRVAVWCVPIAIGVALMFAAIGANAFGWLPFP